jgi:Holliday junction resolvase RusA-like endonuclease
VIEPLVFTMPGLPVAKGRPRFVRASGRTYTPAATVKGERGIAQFAAEAMRGRPLFDMPVELRVIARYLPPKTRTRAQRRLPWADYKGTRPDGDNLLKAILDAGNGVIWTDDALVASFHLAKIYGMQPGIHVSVHPLAADSWPFSGYVAMSRATPSDAPAGLFAGEGLNQ